MQKFFSFCEKFCVLPIILVALSDCSNPFQPIAPIPVNHIKYSPLNYWANHDGTANIRGQGFMRTVGGQIITCAGNHVYAVPDTKGSKGMLAAYQLASVDSQDSEGISANETGVSEKYMKHIRQTSCDAQGNFLFNNLPEGRWSISTSVNWMAGTLPQGGPLFDTILLKNGTSKSIIMK